MEVDVAEGRGEDGGGGALFLPPEPEPVAATGLRVVEDDM